MAIRPAKERPGRSAWLGPVAMGLGLVSWVVPFGEVVAAVALASGGVSIATRREFRIDWTAVAGIVLAAVQLYVALLLVVITSSGF